MEILYSPEKEIQEIIERTNLSSYSRLDLLHLIMREGKGHLPPDLVREAIMEIEPSKLTPITVFVFDGLDIFNEYHRKVMYIKGNGLFGIYGENEMHVKISDTYSTLESATSFILTALHGRNLTSFNSHDESHDMFNNLWI